MKNYILMAVAAVAVAVTLVLGFGEAPTQVSPGLAAHAGQSESTNQNGGQIGNGETAIATFAGGCFWCVESTFEKIDGVIEAVSGYAGGESPNPTYYEVGGGKTNHTETVQIHYDPNVISFPALLHYFWREIDPTDAGGQFVDRGRWYRPAVFYHNDTQKAQIEESLAALSAEGRFSKPIVVEVVPFKKFWDAEEYHQDYYKKSALRYKVYRHGSGRDQYLEKVWGADLKAKYMPTGGSDKSESSSTMPKADSTREYAYSKPDQAELKKILTPLQYKVTQEEGTERPFSNEYWDSKEEGIYVDITSGEPLFSSTDKYDSRTGWPSFSRPISEHFVVEKLDLKLGLPRTEVRSKYGDAHLGHLFKDGPEPTGLRYCINSASLKFVPKEEIVSKGYGEFAKLFDQ